jgi:tetratricopeptide (TPR) repeat protein
MRHARPVAAGILAAMVATASVSAGQEAGCDEAARRAMVDAARLVDEADETGGLARLREAFDTHRECGALAVAFWASTGLAHARHAAMRGGPPELIAPVEEALNELAAWHARGGVVRDAEYAGSALRAAVAAAQDERSEMAVWLAHATELAARVGLAEVEPRWPLPAAVLVADQWYGVYRLAEARDAYEAALEATPTAYAYRGLARTFNRMGDIVAACEAYRNLVSWLDTRNPDGVALDEARAYLDRPLCHDR